MAPADRRIAAGRAVRGLLADLSPLRTYPAFRRLWVGETVSTIGTQITTTAVAVQVYDITGSSFLVGLVSLVALVPLVGFGLIGGAIADSVDRRRLALLTSGGLAAVSAGLVLFALARHSGGSHGHVSGGGGADAAGLGVGDGLAVVWPLFLIVAVQSGLAAVDGPARRAMTPNLVALRDLPAATALAQIGSTAAMTIGPLIAGTSIAAGGYPLAYGLDLASFTAALYGLFRLPAMPPASAASAASVAAPAAPASTAVAGGGTSRRRVASVGEGLRFLRGQPVLMMTFVVDIIAMVFGMPRALFPELARTQFGGGSTTAGLMYSAVAAGALLGAGLSGPLGRVRRQGAAVVVAIVVWGGAIAVFGLVHNIALAVLLLALAGAADLVSAVFRTSILNVATPDALRGRLQGVFLVVVTGGPRIGDLESGTAASLVSPTFSVVSGGLACVGGVLVAAAAVPALVRYDAAAAIAAAERPAAPSTGAGPSTGAAGPPTEVPRARPADGAEPEPGTFTTS